MAFALPIAGCSLAILALVLSVIAVRFSARSNALPNTVLETVNGFAAELEAYRAEFVKSRQSLEGVLEQVEDTLDRTESKRRSIAATASRVTKVADDVPSQQTDPMRMSRIELERLARQSGLMS